MPNELIQYAFVAGEISPKFIGRPDYQKYDFGLAKALNWVVDFRGGIMTRPGKIFIDYIQHADKETRTFKFQYSPDTSNTYVVLFGHTYIRFIQNGAYVVESNVTISGATVASPVVITATSHGYSNGDWVKVSGVVGMTELNLRTFEVANKTTNTFELVDVTTGTSLAGAAYTAYGSGGVVNRIYTITSPYTHTDLARLQSFQERDILRLTHNSYPIKNLTRINATNWTIADEVIGAAGARPTNVSGIASGVGTAGAMFIITAVDINGNESLQSDPLLLTAIVNYGTTAGQVSLLWTGVTGTDHYRIYRSVIATVGTTVDSASQVGFIGTTKGLAFVDNNIIPDYTLAPPIQNNPFADGRLLNVTITTPGSGYSSNPTISFSGGGGSGAIAEGVVNRGGAFVNGVVIIHGGSGYTSIPTVVFTGGGGTGAAGTVTISPSSGNNPATSSIFQQRQLYAATDNFPLTIEGSKPGQFSDFDYSPIINSADAYSHTIDSSQVSPIRHLRKMRGGLIVMSQSGVWQLTGNTSGVITPTDALAEPQTYFGCAAIEPLNIDTDILYVAEKESTVHLLSYNDYSKLYGGEDMALLSSHLFAADNRIIRWAYSESPHRWVWAIREDGTILCFTLVRSQNVFAWTRCNTQGKYKDIISVEEDGVDVLYTTVEREINGQTVKMLEQFAPREFDQIENSINTDASLSLGNTQPAATITFSAATDTITITASSAIFTSGDVDKIIRGGGGKIKITAYDSSTQLTGFVLQPITNLRPVKETPYSLLTGEWTLDAKVTEISGLWHLEGEDVQVLGDGSVINGCSVSAGSITLPYGVTRAVIGLQKNCQLQTLPPTAPEAVIEHKRKSIPAITLRRHETRGLKIGPTLDSTYPLKDRTTETWGEAVKAKEGVKLALLNDNWDDEGQLWVTQTDPLPATILSIIVDLEIGDDSD